LLHATIMLEEVDEHLILALRVPKNPGSSEALNLIRSAEPDADSRVYAVSAVCTFQGLAADAPCKGNDKMTGI